MLSRLLSGMPLRPLSPDEAKIFAKHQHDKKVQKEAQKDNGDKLSTIEKIQRSSILTDAPEVLNGFKLKPGGEDSGTSPDTTDFTGADVKHR